MRSVTARLIAIRLSLLLTTTIVAPDTLAQPAPPEPPAPPEISVKGFRIAPGETHKGDIVRFAPSATIEGTLDGDMYLTAPMVRISGVVTGDVFVAGSQIDVTGEIKKSFRAAAGNVVIDGVVEGNVLVTGGALVLGSKAHVKGNVSAYTGQFTHHGVVDGSLTFTGGTAVFGGKVQEDAALTADAIEIEPGARVEGDVSYSTRKQMDDEFKAITGGSVHYDEEPIREKKKKHREDNDLRPTKFGVGKWIAFFTASFLFGCALLAVFGAHEAKVIQAIGSDTLRCAGIGFVSILVTIAVALSIILLITIPFVLIYMVGYIVALYLAKIPVAIWLGRLILNRLNRPRGPYMALFVGLVGIYVVFMLPIIGVLAQCLAALLGMGAMTMTYLAHRQSRKAAVVAA